MEVKIESPNITNFLQIRLDKNVIDYLWNAIEVAKKNNKSHKSRLAGNISKSFTLKDLDSFFYKSVCIPLIKCYRENNKLERGSDPVNLNAITGSKTTLLLNQFWVNYQYKTEFNPLHHHTGVYSFVIWMKIPYDWEDQIKLPQFRDIKKNDIKAGNFEFEYTDILGDVRTRPYNLSPKYEGTMIFFPARLRHCVYPFYETEEPRISISGNLSYYPGGEINRPAI